MKRRSYRVQEPPFNVTIELSRGCNLACKFCAMPAIQEKQGKGYSFMTVETITSVARQIKELRWNCRVGFAMRGEPTMNPNYVEMVGVVREHLPKCHITMLTNAGGLLRKPGPVANVTGLFDAGLSVLGLDDYVDVGLVPRVLDALSENGKLVSGRRHPMGFTFYKYPLDLAGNPHVRRPRGSRTLIQIRDISVQDADKKIGTHGKLFNYAGLGAAPSDKMAGKRCHHPFRQFVVHWDGNVPACCNSWDSPYNCGNVLTDGMATVWQSNAMGALREKLIRGERDFKPCQGCDHRSYRVGLLPDLTGKGRLHRPDAQTYADIDEALSHGVRDKVVRVPWKDQSR